MSVSEIPSWRRQPGWLGPALWVICIASIVTSAQKAYEDPEWNLDGVFYSALMRDEGESVEAMHAGVYAAIEREASQTAFELLVDGSSYRRQLRTSPDVFKLQLPFYQSKPLYRWVGRGLTLAGISCARAPYLLSACAFAFLLLLLPLLTVRAGAHPWAAALLGATAAWIPPLRELGALATPDALATLFVLAGGLASLWSASLAMIPLLVAVLARPDCALLGLGVVASSHLRKVGPRRYLAAFVFGALLLLLGAAVVTTTGGYGWSTVVRHTFLGTIVDQAGLGRGLDVADYFKALGRGLRGHMTSHLPSAPLFLCIAGVGWWFYMKRERPSELRPITFLMVGVWAVSFVRFLAVPLWADRLFAASYLCSLAQICVVAAPVARRSVGVLGQRAARSVRA